MEIKHFIILTVLSFVASAGAECDKGWVVYHDQQCLKSFTKLLSYDDAREFCSSQGNSISKSSLVTVTNSNSQAVLNNFTRNIYDNLWLGGRYESSTNNFIWEDGVALIYTNWQEGYPRNITRSDTCIELRPSSDALPDKSTGKWTDVSCRKRNMVICQRPMSPILTLESAIGDIEKLKQELNTLRQDLHKISSRVVPVGSVYIEYYSQPSPVTLWPELTWEDISNSYAGLFFRASGDYSGGWGEIQSDCSSRITQMKYEYAEHNSGSKFSSVSEIPSSGWSNGGYAGAFDINASGRWYHEGLKFHTEYCETRPINQAIRVWKRTA